MAFGDDIDSVFIKMETYGLSGTVPGIKDITAMRSLVSIGGVLLFIPYKDDASYSVIKDPSILDANNNSVYSDGYIQRPDEFKVKSFIPQYIDFTSYATLYLTFRTIYRSNSVADVGDIALNSLFNWLKQFRNEDPPEGWDGSKVGNVILDGLLGIIDLLQKGFSIDQVNSIFLERAKTSDAALTNNPALFKEFKESIYSILGKYTTLFTSKSYEAGEDLINIFSSGKNIATAGRSVSDVLTLPSEFFELLHDIVMVMYKYSNLPLPIHIPRKGWTFGTPSRIDFHHSSKAVNVTLVDISLSLQEVLSSSFINVLEVKKEGSDVKPQLSAADEVSGKDKEIKGTKAAEEAKLNDRSIKLYRTTEATRVNSPLLSSKSVGV